MPRRTSQLPLFPPATARYEPEASAAATPSAAGTHPTAITPPAVVWPPAAANPPVAATSPAAATPPLAGQLKPILKWAGGKRWLVPTLRRLWAHHHHRRLVEPMCGGLAVTLGLMPARALLNDVNPHLINFYRWVKAGLNFTVPMRNDAAMYYEHRRRFNELIRQGNAETSEAAQLFYYLNRTGYNGLCRFNRRGEFNVPFGRYKRINYEPDLIPYQHAFARWEFRTGDFAGLALEPDDFVYADPPYDVEFTQYAQDGFGWNDQVRLAEWLARHPGPVVLSNQATPRIIELYQRLGFQLEYLDAPRMISCDGNRTRAREVLALKGV